MSISLWPHGRQHSPCFPVYHQLLELLKLTSIESVMPSNHLFLCHPLLLLCPPLFYLASKLLIVLIGEQFYVHFSVLDASGASLSNAHQGGYPPNRKKSLSLWSGCLLIQLLRKRRLSLHYCICYSLQLLCGISFYEWNKFLSVFSWNSILVLSHIFR